MQAQYAVVHLQPPDYYDSLQCAHNSSRSVPDPYIVAPDAAQNFTNGFSRGSSFPYPHQDYRYLFDRGDLTSRLCPTNLVDHTFDATGLGFAGDPLPANTFAGTEDIPVYGHAAWDWSGSSSNGVVAPVPVYAALLDPPYLASKPSGIHQLPSVERSPPVQLPTPAAMAILLNPHGRSDGEQLQSGYSEALTEVSPLVPNHMSASVRPIIRPEEAAVIIQSQGTSEGPPREKKHACTMCHKRFDRPSTLKKHLLVHTGEKAFVCDTCGRRFGVASNLNRHVKRCVLKPVNATSPSNKSSISSVTNSPDISIMSSPNQTMPSSNALGKRSRASSATSSNISPPDIDSTQPIASALNNVSSKSKPPGQKRRRRAPSPSQWVPETLQNFNLLSEDSYRVAPVPLPPVRRNPPNEERDSWDENVSQTPYHPCGWRGILPGPALGHGFGLGGKDMRNLDLGGRGGFMLGRVLVF